MAISRSKNLTLNEIIEELEQQENEDYVPVVITIMPPENCNAYATDEDSGDENEVNLHNLPGSQLRATAEIDCKSSSEESSDEDDLPLSQLSKRHRLQESSSMDNPSSCSSLVNELSVTPSTSTSTVSEGISLANFKNKLYSWISRDIHPHHNQWQDKQGPINKKKPIEYFNCMFDTKIIDLLVKYSNLYAAQKNKHGNITASEMKCFLGILLLSGYLVVPRRRMYWENSPDSGIPLVSNAMSRDRFDFIMANLHCCDNSNLNPHDKFSKLSLLFDQLNSIFLKFAPFEECHSIDEAMVPYYGGHPCKQFIRGKPIRWGYKLWVGTTRLGYVIWFQPYQGQKGQTDNKYQSLGVGASVVLQYADEVRKIDTEAPFHLFFDNFFTSIPLIDELGKRGLKATGTVRENRLSKCPLPPNKVIQKTNRGSYTYKSTRAEEIIVCKWNDNSVVTAASNAAKVFPVSKVKRFSQQQKKYIQVDQPAIIKLYNENMGGVDRSDQNIGLYRTSIRGKKWYFSLISHSLDMATHNAWQLYKNDGGDQDHLKFRRNIAVSLLEANMKPETHKGGRPSSSVLSTIQYNHNGHLVKYREDRLRCGYCHKSANFYCMKCNVTLHPKSCFEAYHTYAK